MNQPGNGPDRTKLTRCDCPFEFNGNPLESFLLAGDRQFAAEFGQLLVPQDFASRELIAQSRRCEPTDRDFCADGNEILF
jgi:hypothetical protein